MPERNFIARKTISLRFSSCQNHSNEKSVTHTHTLDEFQSQQCWQKSSSFISRSEISKRIIFHFHNFLPSSALMNYLFFSSPPPRLLYGDTHKFLNDDGKAVKSFKNSSS